MTAAEDVRVPEGAESPPTPERPAGGPDASNQPPPPPPESDPSQEYDPDGSTERPATNDNERDLEDPADEAAQPEETKTGPPNPPKSEDD